MNRWIDVKKRKPEIDGNYLVCMSPGTNDSWVTMARLSCTGHWSLNGKWILPTHWMPLPKPPRVKK